MDNSVSIASAKCPARGNWSSPAPRIFSCTRYAATGWKSSASFIASSNGRNRSDAVAPRPSVTFTYLARAGEPDDPAVITITPCPLPRRPWSGRRAPPPLICMTRRWTAASGSLSSSVGRRSSPAKFGARSAACRRTFAMTATSRIAIIQPAVRPGMSCRSSKSRRHSGC